MASQRSKLQRQVKELRQEKTLCRLCGRVVPSGLILGGKGLTFSELIQESQMTWEKIEEEIAARGMMCRRCANLSYSREHLGASKKSGGREKRELTLLERFGSMGRIEEWFDKNVTEDIALVKYVWDGLWEAGMIVPDQSKPNGFRVNPEYVRQG